MSKRLQTTEERKQFLFDGINIFREWLSFSMQEEATEDETEERLLDTMAKLIKAGYKRSDYGWIEGARVSPDGNNFSNSRTMELVHEYLPKEAGSGAWAGLIAALLYINPFLWETGGEKDIEGSSLLSVPTSAPISLIRDFYGSGDNLKALKKRKKSYSHSADIDIAAKDEGRQLRYTKGKNKIVLGIDDVQKVASRNPQVKKIFTRILIKASEQAVHDGKLSQDKISFSLQDLVGEGQYKNIETARQGFYNSMKLLIGLSVSATEKQGTRMKKGAQAVLFKAFKVDNACCEVYLNDVFTWGIVFQFYTKVPDYYFELPDRAAELLLYIFELARQNKSKIKENGYFTISYRALQYKLNLPDENSQSHKLKQQIKDEIGKIVKQIEEKRREDSNSENEFSIVQCEDYTAPMGKYLDEGYLKISFSGEYAEMIAGIGRKTAAEIELKGAEKQGDLPLHMEDFFS